MHNWGLTLNKHDGWRGVYKYVKQIFKKYVKFYLQDSVKSVASCQLLRLQNNKTKPVGHRSFHSLLF